MQTTTASKGHTLIYPSKGSPRACLYISKRIDPTAWSVIAEEPDLVGIELRESNRTINIFSAYNPSVSKTSEEAPTVELLKRHTDPGQLNIALGDFNLHHPLWGGEKVLNNPHKAADKLLDLATDLDWTQTVPVGTETWQERGLASTIDLVWIPQAMEQDTTTRLVSHLSQQSDHKPIETIIKMITPAANQKLRRNWAKADEAAIIKGLE
jgi:hypothetical protein